MTGSPSRTVAPVSAVCAAFAAQPSALPAGDSKTGRCADVRECPAELQHRSRSACGQLSAEKRAESGEAGENPGAFLRRADHFCPQCGQF